MGMDAIVTVWVGLNLDKPDLDWEAITEKLPEGFIDLVEDEDDKAHGITFIDCSENRAGFGIKIFRHNWDYGVGEFSLTELAVKEQAAQTIMWNLFQECGIDAQIGTWVQTDYW